MIRSLDAIKATGPDKIPVKIVKMWAYIIVKYLINIINNDLLRNSFLDSAKIASVRPMFNRERTEMENNRAVSIFNCFSKIHERFLHNQIAFFSNKFLSDFISAYRRGYSTNCFSKIHERFLHNQIASFLNKFLSDLISAYRKGYSTNHVLIRLIENCKTTLDKNLFTGAFLWTYLKRLTIFHTTYSLLNSMLKD